MSEGVALAGDRTDVLICIAAQRLLLGEKVRHNSVGVAMTHLVLGLEDADKLHVLQWPRLLDHFEPVTDWLSVCLLDRGNVRRWAFDLRFSCHHSVLCTLGLVL